MTHNNDIELNKVAKHEFNVQTVMNAIRISPIQLSIFWQTGETFSKEYKGTFKLSLAFSRLRNNSTSQD